MQEGDQEAQRQHHVCESASACTSPVVKHGRAAHLDTLRVICEDLGVALHGLSGYGGAAATLRSVRPCCWDAGSIQPVKLHHAIIRC
jgi:hypothetical protein